MEARSPRAVLGPALHRDCDDVVQRASEEVHGCGRQEGVKKWILRKAFDLPGGRAYLPAEVLWRQKEQFSDGVGYSWIEGGKAHAEKSVTD